MNIFNNPLVDTHFHPPPDVASGVYAGEAKEAGVWGLLAVGADSAECVRARDFAAASPGAWFSAGIHPHASKDWNGDLAPFVEYAANARFVAVGEIGLDYYYEYADPSTQRRVLSKFLEFATMVKRPVILHVRDREDQDAAYRDLFAAAGDFLSAGGGAVLHCYTGSVAWAERFLAAGALLGVTGIVTFPRGDNVRDVVRSIPAERLLLETDSPYLAPIPHRGKPNHSRYLPEIARRVAAERGVTTESLAATTTANACRLFGIAVPEKNHE
jgi:TatD DNase family protein